MKQRWEGQGTSFLCCSFSCACCVLVWGADTAIDQIYQCYGKNLSVSKIYKILMNILVCFVDYFFCIHLVGRKKEDDIWHLQVRSSRFNEVARVHKTNSAELFSLRIAL